LHVQERAASVGIHVAGVGESAFGEGARWGFTDRELRLPVPDSRGRFASVWYPDMAAKKNFSMRVAPDQSLLVLDRDATGRWPLVRLRGWWTGKPVSEVLEIPGWSAGDAKHIADIVVDLQVTPDGRYAVAFAGALWMNTSSFLLRAPKGYVERKPDTVITVVDLERWRWSQACTRLRSSIVLWEGRGL
jgi:hypothetical protein